MIRKNDNWTLFLDRDGVINKERPDDYVKCVEEFIFEPDVLPAMEYLAGVFDRLILVTNQRGVGSGVMSQQDLDDVHAHMKAHLQEYGVHFSGIYFATDKDRNSKRRKPHPYMGHQAKQDFPEIDFRKSIMVGNSRGDIEFGKSLGMITVFIDDKSRLPGEHSAYGSDFLAPSLKAFADGLLAGTIVPGER